jgi:hypothetical protein
MEWCFTKPDLSIVATRYPRNWTASLSGLPRETQNFKLLSFGDLIVPGEYHIHSRFRRVSNYLCDGNLVSVVDTTIGSGPFNVVINDFVHLKADCVIVDHDVIHIGNIHYACSSAQLYNSSIKIPSSSDLRTFQFNLLQFKKILQALAPSKSLIYLLEDTRDCPHAGTFERILTDRFITCKNMIKSGKILEGVNAIKGLGFGLTPSGDDFIAGMLIALNLQQKLYHNNNFDLIEDIHTLSKNENALSSAFLWSAKQGHAFEKLKLTISALFIHDRDELVKRTMDLLKVGATSGADIAVGLIMGLEEVRTL